MINRRLVQRYALHRLLKFALIIASISSAIMAIAAKLDFGGISIIIITVFIFFSMNGVISATSIAAALDEVQDIAGSASALIGSLQYGSGIISSLLLAFMSDGTPWTM